MEASEEVISVSKEFVSRRLPDTQRKSVMQRNKASDCYVLGRIPEKA